MFRQYIEVGERKWGIIVYYFVGPKDFIEIEDALIQLDCSDEDIDKALKVLSKKNTGFTFSNTEYKMSLVCIAKTTDISQFISTITHEAKHVQSHICSYYNVKENTEPAAYLIGYIAKQMYKVLARVFKKYV